MTFFNSPLQKIINWSKNPVKNLDFFGLNSDQWSFLHHLNMRDKNNELYSKSHVMICPSLEKAEIIHESLKKTCPDHNVSLFPGLDISPYSGVIPSESSLFHRFKVLDNIIDSPKPSIILATFESLSLKIPDKSFFIENSFSIEVTDICPPLDLAKKLVERGYSSSTTVEEAGTFSLKGEIFDVYPISGKPVRIHYFDDMVEEIYAIDLQTYKTNRDLSYEVVKICPSPLIFSRAPFSTKLRENIPMPGPQFRNKFNVRKKIFNQLIDNHLFEEYPSFTPLFVKDSTTLLEYFDSTKTFVHVIEKMQTSQNQYEYFDDLRESYELNNTDSSNESLLPSPDKLYDLKVSEHLNLFPVITINELEITENDDHSLKNKIELTLEKSKHYINQNINPALNRPDYIKESLSFLKKEFELSGHIIITTQSENSKKEILHLIDILNFNETIKSRIHFLNFKIPEGFYYKHEKLLVLSDSDFFTVKKKKTKAHKKQDIDLFAEQLATLKQGDYVIHSEHGLGEYIGLESLEVGGNKTDYLVILYKGNDKIYVPVYKMNLIQKHADSEASLKPDSLRTNKFEALKAKARNSVKKLAFDLLKLQAERQSSSAFSFSAPDHEFKEFELAFPFEETPDQTQAINDVVDSMQKSSPMDHLVCGDVGFGKTEVAMRAAYKAVLDQKQVAVLVPTTVLAMQHFNSFCKRFSNFPVNIEIISRFKTAKQVKEVIEKLEQGKIDILIGTHKLLSEKIKYKDLGLVVVDEEQRFGVSHKEKLKLLKSSVDFLTLTATPIPRTLQLAFLGIRDLTLIRTAPPRRQSIKTYLIKEDDKTIQTAIRKELNRGGQVFIIHNRVNDIEQYTAYIKDLVPESKIVFAHGQLSEKELESRMEAFYSGAYQILIATTIIESGIDIPNANTIIVNKADMFGLSQLHQLRGRIGRSDRKAYAYFVVPKNKILTTVAEKRLKALHTYSEMGAGFKIASCDLEIRGAGDILGASQSGHIEAIGLELYMELLKEAIFELKGEKQIFKKDIEVTTPFPSYIPNYFITDSSDRLKYYKKLSNCVDIDHLEDLRDELQDIFGIIPQELNNLLTLLEVRINLQHCGLKKVQVAGRIINLNFEKSFLESNKVLRDNVVDLFLSRPKIYQFTPDFKVIYSHTSEVSPTDLLDFAKDIAEKIVPYK